MIEDFETELWIYVVSFWAASSISCVFLSGIFNIVLLSKICLNFVQTMGPLARLGFSLVMVVVFRDSITAEWSEESSFIF